ncbi:unnamed protein product [Prunus armeniaca]
MRDRPNKVDISRILSVNMSNLMLKVMVAEDQKLKDTAKNDQSIRTGLSKSLLHPRHPFIPFCNRGTPSSTTIYPNPCSHRRKRQTHPPAWPSNERPFEAIMVERHVYAFNAY